MYSFLINFIPPLDKEDRGMGRGKYIFCGFITVQIIITGTKLEAVYVRNCKNLNLLLKSKQNLNWKLPPHSTLNISSFSSFSHFLTEKYLMITNKAKLSYAVFIFKSCLYGAFVGFLVWRLQVCWTWTPITLHCPKKIKTTKIKANTTVCLALTQIVLYVCYRVHQENVKNKSWAVDWPKIWDLDQLCFL